MKLYPVPQEKGYYAHIFIDFGDHAFCLILQTQEGRVCIQEGRGLRHSGPSERILLDFYHQSYIPMTITPELVATTLADPLPLLMECLL